MGEGEPGEVGVGYLRERGRNSIDGGTRDVTGRCLAEDEGEVKDEFLVI